MAVQNTGPWLTPDLTERLVALHKHTKHSATKIAKILSDEFNVPINRCQVIGKTRRLKLKPRERPRPQGPTQRPSRALVKVPAPPVPTPIIDRSRLRLATLPIVRRRSSECSFLYGDYPYVCCEEPRQEGSSYCVWHDRKVHVPPKEYEARRRS